VEDAFIFFKNVQYFIRTVASLGFNFDCKETALCAQMGKKYPVLFYKVQSE
jgi:hypothetical protein